MAQMLSGVQGRLVKLNIAFSTKPTVTGARTQYQIVPAKKYLDPEKAEDSKLRKFTIGKKDPQKPTKTVLLVGETGAGKSSLIDAMLNHLMGIEYKDNEWCKIIDEDVKKTTSSQTETITVYEMCGFHTEEFPYSLTIIDTPGYGDTRGIDRDLQITKALELLFKDEVKEIDAVGLVLKESTNRLDNRQSYVFNSVVSLFGKDIENKIVALITHSSGQPNDNPLNALAEAKIKVARDENNEPIHFLFNNNQTEVSKGKRYENARACAWSTSNYGMEDFFDFLKKVKSQKLTQTADVLTKRIELEAYADNWSDEVKMIEAEQNVILQTMEAVQKLDLESDKAVKTITVPETYKETEKSDARWFNKTTVCTVCQINCHKECSCSMLLGHPYCVYMENHPSRFLSCAVCNCDSDTHTRVPWRYVTSTRQVEKTVEDLEKKYEIKGKKGELEGKLKEEQDELARKKAKVIDKIYQCVVKLDQNALKSNSIHTYKYLDFLIEKLKKLGDERNNDNKELGDERNKDKIKTLTDVKTRIEKEESEGIGYAGFLSKLRKTSN